MDVRYYINTWRKFWNFLEGLYPVLGRVRQKTGDAVSRASKALGLSAFWSRLGAGSHGQAINRLDPFGRILLPDINRLDPLGPILLPLPPPSLQSLRSTPLRRDASRLGCFAIGMLC